MIVTHGCIVLRMMVAIDCPPWSFAAIRQSFCRPNWIYLNYSNVWLRRPL